LYKSENPILSPTLYSLLRKRKKKKTKEAKTPQLELTQYAQMFITDKNMFIIWDTRKILKHHDQDTNETIFAGSV
jgi:hypothetical protein